MSTDQAGVLRYHRKPVTADEAVTVAKYEPGASLDALVAVARMADGDAELAEVALPSETVLLVRWTNWSADRPDLDWEVIQAGRYLGYSRNHSFLYSTDDNDLRQFYELTDADRSV